jgi:acetyl-CoA carboxylase biotin carboxyl carrier protein
LSAGNLDAAITLTEGTAMGIKRITRGRARKPLAPTRKTAMDIDRVKTLVRLMVDNDLSELVIRSGEDRISLRRGPAGVVTTPAAAVVIAAAPPAAAPATAAPPAAVAAPPGDDLVSIPSPMVGTFYAAPSPDSAPYVSIGSEIAEDSVVCIVEAMKVMNEIKAELGGTVAKIMVNSGQAVEYGQPLFMVRKS